MYDADTIEAMEAKGFLSLQSAAKAAQTKPNTLSQAIRRGTLQAVRMRGRVFVGKEALIRWLGEDAARVLGLTGNE